MRATWPWTTFRILSTITAVLLVDQAVFAGQFLTGSFGALQSHRDNATYAGLAALASALTGLPIRWRGGGPWWPALACAGLFALIAAQIALGFARLLTVHVPLGVMIIALSLAVTTRAWRTPAPRPAEPPRTSEPDRAAAPAAEPDRAAEPDPRTRPLRDAKPDRNVPVGGGNDAGAGRS